MLRKHLWSDRSQLLTSVLVKVITQLRRIVMGLGPLHTRDREPVTITLQALSLVEKAEPVQVHFPLRWRDQRST
jgi:hypothetical protein